MLAPILVELSWSALPPPLSIIVGFVVLFIFSPSKQSQCVYHHKCLLSIALVTPFLTSIVHIPSYCGHSKHHMSHDTTCWLYFLLT
ncbi:uncharacterized protein B0H64DRAFT_66762 [Chaetomium fimeti]|uniref:Uncharacterized protein n=1 Tax=Chaetomium fimeti TaxID=1854472 RepID=A0AAE0HKG5_9PEZI|nr:hypothetical protein B0H64DRAFT_66762 [Chaetomium fimeti]